MVEQLRINHNFLGEFMLPRPLRAVWGDLTIEEIKKFGILASIFFVVIGIYWMLKTMKDPIFDLHVGFKYQPWAKIASLVFVGLTVIFYSKLVDLFKKQTVFYIICSLYGCSFLILSYFLSHPELVNTHFCCIPGNILGWACYVFIESFGSIMPALFWAFVASVTTTDSAKRGYAMIATCTQVGTIFGPFLISKYGSYVGLPIFFGLSGLLILFVPLIPRYYSRVIPQPAATAPQDLHQKKRSGFVEGLRLLLTQPYLMGIFAIATFYEFIGTILDFQKGMLISQNYPSRLDDGVGFAWFKGIEGSAIGIVSLMFALFGTSFFMRKFGLKFCLLCFPTVIGITMITVFSLYYMGANSYQLMWIFFAAIVLIKGLNYALNNPTREVLYIPTSSDVKFKTKGWIDAFGARLLKTFGASVNNTLSASLGMLLTMGTFLSLGVVGIWMYAALYVSGSFDNLQRTNKIIE